MEKRNKIVLSIVLCCFMALCVILGVLSIKKPNVSFAVEETHNHANFTAWGDKEEEQGFLPKEAGSYVLTHDIFLSDTWTAPSGTTNLCLNGNNVLMSKDCDVIFVPNGATLNIYECNETEMDLLGIKTVGGKILANKKRGITVMGTLNMYNGTVFGAKSGIYVLNGNFNMYGGAITANVYTSEETDTYGAGVLVDGGSFTMNGGGIYGNRLSAYGMGIDLFSYGAGVFVDNEGSFTMNGGEIYGNESDYGSGIYVKNGTFTMTDGEIHDNGDDAKNSFGAGLYLSQNSTASLTGGKIYNNIVHYQNAGAGVYNKGTLSLGGNIKIINNTYNYDGIGRSNLYIDNSGSYDKDVSLISPENGMLVGVSMSIRTSFITTEEIGNEKYFFADKEEEFVSYNGLYIELKNAVGAFDTIYKINIEYCDHGVVYTNLQAVENAIIENTTIYLTVIPEEGYRLKSLKYNDGEDHDITDAKSFKMVDSNVTIYPEFEKMIVICPEKPATCLEAGYLGYYVFSGRYFTDENCDNEILDITAWLSESGDGYIAPTGHDYETTYEWNDDYTVCTGEKRCRYCEEVLASETKTAYEYDFVLDTVGNCKTNHMGHNVVYFGNDEFGIAESPENSFKFGYGYHTDEDGDGICDDCEETLTATGSIFKSGIFRFMITDGEEKTVTVMDDNSMLITVGNDVYLYPYGIAQSSYVGDLVIPETVTYGGKTFTVTAVGTDDVNEINIVGMPFLGCTGITSITLPDALIFVGESAFSGCSGLTEIVIPENVEKICPAAFLGCDNLKTVVFKSKDITKAPHGDFIVIGAFDLNNSVVMVIVPVGTAESYKAEWQCFADIIVENYKEYTFKAEWSYNELVHWHDNLCEDCDIVSGFGTHTFDDGVESGNTTVYTCTDCGYSYTDCGVTYTWNGRICTAKHSCLYGSEMDEVIEMVEGEYVKDFDATCLACEKGHYKATFSNPLFTEQETTMFDKENSALGHDFTITYTWNNEHTKCTATAICTKGDCDTTEEGKMFYVKDSDATTANNEKGHYEATFENSIFAKQIGERNSVEVPNTMIVEENSGCFGAISISNVSIIVSVGLIAFGIMMIIRKRKKKNA